MLQAATKTKLEWFPVDAAQTLSDQDYLGLNMQEVGAYWMIRLFCWKDGSVPASPDRLAVLCRTTPRQMEKVLRGLEHLLVAHPERSERLMMPFVEEGREIQNEYREKKRAAGAKGGKASRAKASPTTAQASAKKTAAPVGRNPTSASRAPRSARSASKSASTASEPASNASEPTLKPASTTSEPESAVFEAIPEPASSASEPESTACALVSSACEPVSRACEPASSASQPTSTAPPSKEKEKKEKKRKETPPPTPAPSKAAPTPEQTEPAPLQLVHSTPQREEDRKRAHQRKGYEPTPRGNESRSGRGEWTSLGQMTAFELQETIFDAHDFGLRVFADVTGQPMQAHNRKVASRRKAVAQAIRNFGVETTQLAARNIALSAHHRGENDKRTPYLDIEYALRRPDAFANLFRGPNDRLAEAIRKSLQPESVPGAGYHHADGITRGEVEWQS